MKKAFVITGLTFALFIVLIIGVNYVILAKNSNVSSSTLNMKIDKVYNRYIDTYRALEAARSEALASTEEGVTCEIYLSSVLMDSTLDIDGVNVEGSAVGCEASFIVKANDGSVVKKGTFP